MEKVVGNIERKYRFLPKRMAFNDLKLMFKVFYGSLL